MTVEPAEPASSSARRPPGDDTVPMYRSSLLRVLTALTSLGVGVGVVFFAGDGYFSPTQRGVLFFLVAALPAILFAAEAAAVFRFSLPQFAFSAGGGTAVMMGFLTLLFHLTRPDFVTLAFPVVSEQGRPISLSGPQSTVEVTSPRGAPAVVHYVADHVLILQYPEQTPTATVTVRPHTGARLFRGEVSYTAPPSELRLGVELVDREPRSQ